MSRYKYDAVVSVDNYNNSHTLAFYFIADMGRSGLRILEVGCSAGYFGASLKAIGHHVVGVEPDERSAQKAKTVLDEVYCGFVEDFLAANPDLRFDVIVFGDVLEHLRDPEAVLRLVKTHLADKGRLVVSVPNVTHGAIRAMLMQGEWIYSELGILDKTHLRFFTKESLVRLLDSAGFRVEGLQSVRLPIDTAADMCSLTLSARAVRQVMAIKCDDTVEDFQYVACATVGAEQSVHAQKLSRRKVLKIVILSEQPTSTLTKLRLLLPLRQFASEGGRSLALQSFDKFALSDLQWGDVFVMQRGCTQQALRIAQLIEVTGKPLIYEIDDLLTALPAFLGHHSAFVKNRKNILKCMNSASIVTVTNERLATALGVPRSKVAICPNFARPTSDLPIFADPMIGEGAVTLIVASSDRVLVDFLVEPILTVQKKYGDRVRFVCIGPIGEAFKKAGVVGKYEDILAYDKFSPFMGQFTNPIGIIPLDDSVFSSCKSPVKFFDYAMAGVPVICSDTSPYKDVIDHGRNGLLVLNTNAAWVEGLSGLIDDPGLRQSLMQAAKEKVLREHGIRSTVEAWRRVFERIAPDDQIRREGIGLGSLISTGAALTGVKFWLRELNRVRKAKRRATQRRLQSKGEPQPKSHIGDV